MSASDADDELSALSSTESTPELTSSDSDTKSDTSATTTTTAKEYKVPDKEIPKQAWPSEESEGKCVTVTDVSEESKGGSGGAVEESGNESWGPNYR